MYISLSLQGVVSFVILSVHSHIFPCQGNNLLIEALTVSPPGYEILHEATVPAKATGRDQGSARMTLDPGGTRSLVGNVNESSLRAVGRSGCRFIEVCLFFSA